MNNIKCFLFLCFIFLKICKISCTHITIFPYEKDCFRFLADAHNIIVGSYEILDGSNSCKIVIHGGSASEPPPKEEILFSSVSPRQKFDLKTKHKGMYSFCYENDTSAELSLIFTLRVKESAFEINEAELSTVSDVQKINDETHKLYEQFLEVFDEQQRMLEIADLYSRVNEKTHSKLILWSEIQIVCTIAFTIIHLYYIRSFFEIKTIV